MTDTEAAGTAPPPTTGKTAANDTETEFMPSARRRSHGSIGAFPFFVAMFLGTLALLDWLRGEADASVTTVNVSRGRSP